MLDETDEELMAKVEELAANLFAKGYNCDIILLTFIGLSGMMMEIIQNLW